MTLLELGGIDAGYGEVRVVHGVSLAVAPGSVTALIGSNGAGKTTLMRAIAGLLPADGGSLRFDGHDLGRLPADRRVAAGLALVPEGRLIFPELSVEENLRIGGHVARARAGRSARIMEMYALFPQLGERRDQAGETLSGGEQQMLAIARGLMSQPKLLLLDEPSLGLAPIMARLLFDTIVRIRAAGVTIFIVEQDVRSTLAIADRAYVLENGRIVRQGDGAGLLHDPAVREAYLGL